MEMSRSDSLASPPATPAWAMTTDRAPPRVARSARMQSVARVRTPWWPRGGVPLSGPVGLVLLVRVLGLVLLAGRAGVAGGGGGGGGGGAGARGGAPASGAPRGW